MQNMAHVENMNIIFVSEILFEISLNLQNLINICIFCVEAEFSKKTLEFLENSAFFVYDDCGLVSCLKLPLDSIYPLGYRGNIEF